MKMRWFALPVTALFAGLAAQQGLHAQTGAPVPSAYPAVPGMAGSGGNLPPPKLPPPPEASAAEPIARAASAAQAQHYLETVAVNWVQQRQCGTCHTSYAYMMAAPALSPTPTANEKEVRSFFDDRVYLRTSRPSLPHTLILSGVLSINDSQRGTLSKATREALDQAWEMQDGGGAWTYPRIFYSPPLGDPYYGAMMVAIATGLAPENYAQTPQAQAGMANLKRWLATHPAPSLHHRLLLLWAADHTPGLMSDQDKARTIADVRALQHPDGGWAITTLGEWNRRDGSANDVHAASDGYATGLITYVLQDAGVAPSDPAMAKGLTWLTTNQRTSGRWYTHSINTDGKGDFISTIGTAYAVMSLRKAGQLPAGAPPARVATR